MLGSNAMLDCSPVSRPPPPPPKEPAESEILLSTTPSIASTTRRPASILSAPACTSASLPVPSSPISAVHSPMSTAYSPISTASTRSHSSMSMASHVATASSMSIHSRFSAFEHPHAVAASTSTTASPTNDTSTDASSAGSRMQSKRLTNHERYMLMRQNLGRPHVICYAVTYSISTLPAREFLEERIIELQTKLPTLYAGVANQYTTKPCFVPGQVPWDPEDIIVESSYVPLRSAANEAALVIKREMERFERYRFNRGDPMWTVALVYGPPDAERAYLVVQVNHILMDGRGLLAFLHALTAGSIDMLPHEPFHKIKRFDDTVNIKPSARFLAPIFWREIIMPRLPRALQQKFAKEDCWPGLQVQRSPLVCGWSLSHISVPAGTVTLLKEKAKLKGVRTLHPILKITYLAALWRTYGQNSYKPMYLVAATSRSERRLSLGHSAITGTYISSQEYHIRFSGSESFWGTCQHFAKWFRSSRAIAEGRYVPGLLSHIDDPDVDLDSPDFDPSAPTAWEKLFLARASSDTPFRDSMYFHNLGPTKLPPGATDLMWMQTASPFGPVFQSNLIGHEGGLRLTAAHAEGAAATKVRTDAMHQAWLRALDRIALSDEDMTISELTA